ncbi:MAG: NUDIX domain-containing protein [Geminicoccaceae bacterium]
MIEASVNRLKRYRVLHPWLRIGFTIVYCAHRQITRLPGRDLSGVRVAVWRADELLLVRHSYRPGLHLPGGARAKGEGEGDAALRELAEEAGLGLAVSAPQRRLGYVYPKRGRTQYTALWEAAHLGGAPRPDGVEIVWAGFLTAEQALTRELSGLTRVYLNDRARNRVWPGFRPL